MADCALVLEVGTSVMDPGQSLGITLVAFVLLFAKEVRFEDGSLQGIFEAQSSWNDSGTGVWRCSGLSSGAGGG